ncbi:copper resistance protein CopC [Psychromicrobium sp. YIM B11713]|uniref:copper resistance CopC family protein n=1 Tax=Psychromicrobium sp. YIM B11713 TaxID=3145233 RepID=UPI00374EAE71
MSLSLSRSVRNPLLRFGRAAFVLLAALALSVLLPAAAASAHDVVESTSPANGSSVATMPQQISLSLNNTPAAIGSKIEVKDASGTDWAQGEVSVLDKVASEQLKAGAPAGYYTVNWRLVSSDGHPIEGSFGFTVGEAASSPATLGTPGPVSTPEAAQTSEAAGGFPWLLVTVAVVAVAILLVLIFFVRRLRKEQ